MPTVNINLLKAKVVERGMNISGLAHKIKMPRCTLYRKLQQPETRLSIRDVNAIVSALHLTTEEAVAIFFGFVVA